MKRNVINIISNNIIIMSNEFELSIAAKVDEITNDTCRIIRNDKEPYTLYCANDISIVIGLENIRASNLLRADKIKVSTMTSTGLKQVSYLTYVGLLKILTKSRKRRSVEFAKSIGIDTTFISFACVEASSIHQIITTFSGEIMIEQYKINNYIIDLYLPKYNLAIECDEKYHKNISKRIEDCQREIAVASLLHCSFIRYEPYEKDFNIFILLNRIFLHINSHNIKIGDKI